jgi:hypothetical protein
MISLFFTIFSPVLNLATFGDGQIIVNFITNFLSAWLPIFNPLSSILTIRSYRNALLDKFVWLYREQPCIQSQCHRLQQSWYNQQQQEIHEGN